MDFVENDLIRINNESARIEDSEGKNLWKEMTEAAKCLQVV